MFNRVRLYFEGVDKGMTSMFKKAESGIKNTNAAAQKSKKSFMQMAGQVAAVSGALIAVGAAAKKAFEFVERGAQLDLTRTKFNNLAKTIVRPPKTQYKKADLGTSHNI